SRSVESVTSATSEREQRDHPRRSADPPARVLAAVASPGRHALPSFPRSLRLRTRTSAAIDDGAAPRGYGICALNGTLVIVFAHEIARRPLSVVRSRNAHVSCSTLYGRASIFIGTRATSFSGVYPYAPHSTVLSF